MPISDTIQLFPKHSLNGETTAAPDKSISHRAIMCGALASGKTVIKNFLLGKDCLSTIDCFRELGVKIEVEDSLVTVFGSGFNLKQPKKVLNVNNSGTTLRLLTGILSGYSMISIIDGDESIRKRPLKRVTEPLFKMGAKFELKEENFCPIKIFGNTLSGINYNLITPSAQVKSAIIFASLKANSKTVITERQKTRDHTERMLKAFGADLKTKGNVIEVNPAKELKGLELTVPSDISSAAFFIAAALITKNSNIKIKNVGINPTRSLSVDIFKKMGGNITLENFKNGFEPSCDIIIKSSNLKGISITGDIPFIIDEIPIIAAAASQAEGITVIENLEELKLKESNRIDTIFTELTRCGVNIVKTNSGLAIYGKNKIKGSNFKSYGDHRIAMMCGILSLIADGISTIENYKCVDISFPDFFNILQNIGVNT